MKVIFLKDVKGQGKKDEIKEVKAGFAQNYLIKNGYAVALTSTSKQKLENDLEKRKEEDKKDKDENLKIKEKLEKLKLIFKLKAGKNEQVFGSISTKQIHSELQKNNIEIDKKKIKLEEAITSLGFHKIKIELRKDVIAELNIQVVKE